MAAPLQPVGAALISPTDRYLHCDRPAGGRSWWTRDTITGRPVFIKAGPVGVACREASILLALPPGLAPAVVDLVVAPREDPAQAWLVEEQLQGQSLQEAAAGLRADDAPALACRLCGALASLHRAGFVHADLKAGNIFLLSDPPGAIRLLDLEFAWSLGESGVEDEEGNLLGGTPGFTAPEILQGWTVDFRADQYALGMTLARVFPRSREDPRWSHILDRMTERRPTRRYADISEVRREIAREFDLAPEETPPLFGAGPMRGRSRERDAVLERVRESPPGSLLLIQARPHTGLSRFLLECARASAGREGPLLPDDARQSALRVLDAGPFCLRLREAPPPDVERALLCLRRWLEEGRTVLLGVPDPSGSLCSDASHVPPALRELIRRADPWRLVLPSLDGGAITGIATASLGSSGAAARSLASILNRRSTGDLELMARGFAAAMTAAGEAQGIAWGLRSEAIDNALASWPETEPRPALGDIASHLQRPLRLVAQAGATVPRELAGRLLERFASREALDELVERGLLLSGDGGSMTFVHDRLWSAARGASLADLDQVERWLNASLRPRPDDVAGTLDAARRARRLGDTARESAWLRAACEAAAREDRWADLRELFSHPRPTPAWPGDEAGERLHELRALLGDAWPEGRILMAAGQAMICLGDPGGLSLLERGAEDPSPEIRARCLVLLCMYTRGPRRAAEYERHLARLEALVASGLADAGGELHLEQGRRALALGRRTEAEELGGRAVRELAGRGGGPEIDSLMFLAVLHLPQRGAEAIGLLRRALEATRVPTSRAMLHYLLSQIHEIRGDLPAFRAAADAALAELGDAGPETHLVPIRTQRAWARALLDQARAAAADAAEMLQDLTMRQERPRSTFVLLLAGFAALHQGRGRAALAHMAAAWERASEINDAKPRAIALRYLIDALLDLQAWDVVREHAEVLVGPGNLEDPGVALTARRAEALLAQARGEWRQAESILEAARTEAAGQSDCLDASRYLHHLGVVRLGLAADEAEAKARLEKAGSEGINRAERARDDLLLALDRFGSIGYGYFRARTLLALARAHQTCGEVEAALDILDHGVQLSRNIGSRGVLAEALNARAELRLAARDDGGPGRT